ncbi:hypothetical protein B0H13DRAFT_1872668 [Mycena leptocephala]|nr:hypothetical protein B0H13DRAFT_1872668 [Mycena leptocephala]
MSTTVELEDNPPSHSPSPRTSLRDASDARPLQEGMENGFTLSPMYELVLEYNQHQDSQLSLFARATHIASRKWLEVSDVMDRVFPRGKTIMSDVNYLFDHVPHLQKELPPGYNRHADWLPHVMRAPSYLENAFPEREPERRTATVTFVEEEEESLAVPMQDSPPLVDPTLRTDKGKAKQVQVAEDVPDITQHTEMPPRAVTPRETSAYWGTASAQFRDQTSQIPSEVWRLPGLLVPPWILSVKLDGCRSQPEFIAFSWTEFQRLETKVGTLQRAIVNAKEKGPLRDLKAPPDPDGTHLAGPGVRRPLEGMETLLMEETIVMEEMIEGVETREILLLPGRGEMLLANRRTRAGHQIHPVLQGRVEEWWRRRGGGESSDGGSSDRRFPYIAPGAPYGTLVPTIEPKLKPDSLPEWDGDPDTAIDYFWTLGKSPSYRAGSAVQLWFVTLPTQRQASMRSHYLVYLQVIKELYLGNKWQLRMNIQFENQAFRQPGFEHEMRTLANSDDGGPLEVFLVMRKAPIKWRTILVIENIPTTEELYKKVNEHDDSLLDAVKSSPTDVVTLHNIASTLRRLGFHQAASPRTYKRVNRAEVEADPGSLEGLSTAPEEVQEEVEEDGEVTLKEVYTCPKVEEAKEHKRRKIQRRRKTLRHGAEGRTIRAAEDYRIKAHECRVVRVEGDFRDDKEWLVERNLLANAEDTFFSVPNTLISARKPCVPVCNMSNKPRMIRKGEIVGTLADPRNSSTNL